GYKARVLAGGVCFVRRGGENRCRAGIADARGGVRVPSLRGDPQVFKVESVVVTHYVERHLLVKVLPLASDFLVLLRQQFSRFIAALAALLATGDEFLRLHQGFLGRAGVAWGLDALSIRRDEKHLQADINPGFTTCQG